ncbi:MAG: cytidine deaminase [Bacilli bacterium]|nr:cytidine deaminase [Bacilli bacterium]
MKEKLKQLSHNAYAPYSNFLVASAVVMNDGSTFYGVNIENASYGATICAERNAINDAIKNGYKAGDFKELYVYHEHNNTFPCFICRQTINEFFNGNEKLILMSDNNEQTHLVKEILTHPFGKEDLK